GGAGVDTGRVPRAEKLRELPLEGRHLVGPVADAVVAKEVAAADDALERRELLVADLHAAGEHRMLGTGPRRRTAVTRQPRRSVGLGLDRHRPRDSFRIR